MPETLFDTIANLSQIRVEQARLLKERAAGSAITVIVFVAIFAVLIGLLISLTAGLIWFGLASFMVALTVLYARFMAPAGITEKNVKAYLQGHTVICCLVGATWGGYAIYILDFSSPTTLTIAGAMPLILTVGGMLPSSAYRPGYIALAIFALLPFAFFLICFAPGALRVFGLGTLTYFGLAMVSSAQAELNTRDGIIARTTQSFTKKLIDKNEEVQRAHDEKTQFLAATSHDFSQPLHAQGYFIQALRPTLETAAQKTLLDKIEVSWKAQSDLLQGLAEITRLDSGAILPKRVSFNIKNELESILTEYEELARRKSIALSSQIENISVFSDPALLKRVIRNLLSNAVKFIPSNGEVNLVLLSDGADAIMTVTDNGPGIAQSEQDKVFEEYFQLDPHKNKAGSGLGLSIVRRLSDLLGLDLKLFSEEGQGTQFEIKLPLSSKETPQTPTSDLTAHPFIGSPLIVLVDDEDTIRESMSNLMTEWGLQVISAATGKDIIELMSETLETPVLLIIDKRLGGSEDGIKLISQLREEVNEDISAILMTGDIAGFDDLFEESDIQIMIKPISPHEMRKAIQDIINLDDT